MEVENLRQLLDQVLTVSVREKASDVYIKANSVPFLRIQGNMYPVECQPLIPQMTEHLAFTIMPVRQREGFETDHPEANFVYALEGVGRFRVNAYKQKGTVAMVLRRVEDEILEFQQLGLPEVLKTLAMQKRGLVLMTGPTGSGKSTTLASMIRYRKENAPGHIVTIEDPIEYLHEHNKSVINQRELGHDTHSFNNALRAALREDPDVILVGEMRDLETIQLAVTCAETGHLVMATLHTNSAAESVDRMIDVFPPEQQEQIRIQLSNNLVAIMSQQLLPRAGQPGRIAAIEVMIANSAIRNLIREAKSHQITSMIQTAGEIGMQTMDQALRDLYKQSMITYEDAMRRAQNPIELEKLIHGGDS